MILVGRAAGVLSLTICCQGAAMRLVIQQPNKASAPAPAHAKTPLRSPAQPRPALYSSLLSIAALLVLLLSTAPRLAPLRHRRRIRPDGSASQISVLASVSTATKVSEDKGSDTKRCKSVESNGTQEEGIKPKSEPNGSVSTGTTEKGNGGKSKGKDTGTKQLPEPPKDYIHVRARRGEATDSHGLAERI